MNYQQALKYIIDRSGYDRGFVANPFAGDEAAALGLRRTAGLLRILNRPEQSFAIVHVAGTKGKGSTSAMTEAIARSAGLKTGLYMTPHLHTFRERMQINREPVSEPEFVDLTEAVAEAAAALERAEPEIGVPTAFEITTAMGLLAFQRAGVDLAVVEVGMGGRLDATNVVDPDVSVITTISMDHMAILGDTLEEIAAEKAGIIKPGCPVVSGPQRPKAGRVIADVARDRGATIYRYDSDFAAETSEGVVSLSGPWGELTGLRLALAGPHQVENAAVAAMASWLVDWDLLEDERSVGEALATVRWPGRFERIATAPDIYVDGAHNVDSIQRLVETVREHRPEDGSVTVILGTSSDKDISGIVQELASLDPRLIVTASKNPRAADPADIAARAREFGLTPETAGSVREALDLAGSQSGSDDLICVTGSLYMVAEARELAELADAPAAERESLYQ